MCQNWHCNPTDFGTEETRERNAQKAFFHSAQAMLYWQTLVPLAAPKEERISADIFTPVLIEVKFKPLNQTLQTLIELVVGLRRTKRTKDEADVGSFWVFFNCSLPPPLPLFPGPQNCVGLCSASIRGECFSKDSAKSLFSCQKGCFILFGCLKRRSR